MWLWVEAVACFYMKTHAPLLVGDQKRHMRKPNTMHASALFILYAVI